MNRGFNSRSFLTALAIVSLVAFLAVMAGCSKTPEVETEPQVDTDKTEDIVETPPPPKPEDVDPVVETPNYAEMAPQDFGIEDVYFAFDQYDLDNEAMSILSRNARILREARVMLLISGHCDERGTIEYNLALGEKRARAVRDYMVSLGVPAAALRITSYGESKPFVSGSNEDAWAKNRRAHFERP